VLNVVWCRAVFFIAQKMTIMGTVDYIAAICLAAAWLICLKSISNNKRMEDGHEITIDNDESD